MATDLAELRLHTRGARRFGRFEPREDRHVRALSDGRMALLKEQLDHLAGRDQDDKDDDKIRKLQRKKPSGVDEFWRYQANGLAVLATPDSMRTYRLQHHPKSLAEVSD